MAVLRSLASLLIVWILLAPVQRPVAEPGFPSHEAFAEDVLHCVDAVLEGDAQDEYRSLEALSAHIFAECVGQVYAFCLTSEHWQTGEFGNVRRLDCYEVESRAWAALASVQYGNLERVISEYYGPQSDSVRSLKDTQQAWENYFAPPCHLKTGMWPPRATLGIEYSFSCGRDAHAEEAISLTVWYNYLRVLWCVDGGCEE